MFLGKKSWLWMRRGTAMALIALWALFTASQAFAGCCAHSGSSSEHTSVVVSSHQHESSREDDCCDVETAGEPCPMTVFVAPGMVPAAEDSWVPAEFRLTAGTAAYRVSPHSTVVRLSGPSRVPVSPPPSDPVFLRLQRFLI